MRIDSASCFPCRFYFNPFLPSFYGIIGIQSLNY